MKHVIERFYAELLVRGGDGERHPKTAKLLSAGRTQIAKKLGEEALELSLEIVKGDRDAVVHESVDLIHHLAVAWASMGIAPSEVWEEMATREALTGLAGKRPKGFEDLT
jgi:phosphoribosyl-ATP pyrophosphohydrolase